jgi:hypothetical protein
MPLTPFIGISVLVHIGIIIGYHFFRWAPVARALKPERVSALVRAFGVGIIGVVFAVILTSATVLVRASVVDKHSSILFMDAMVKDTYATFFPPPVIPPAAAHYLATISSP